MREQAAQSLSQRTGRGKMTKVESVVYSDEYFVIEQCRDCAVTGYLIVSARSGARDLGELAGEERAALGNVLALAVQTVKEVVRPVRVYCAQFGEKGGPLHFHVFPRTEEITREYLRENPTEQDNLIDGPSLLAWCRKRYATRGDRGGPSETIDRIREVLR